MRLLHISLLLHSHLAREEGKKIGINSRENISKLVWEREEFQKRLKGTTWKKKAMSQMKESKYISKSIYWA